MEVGGSGGVDGSGRMGVQLEGCRDWDCGKGDRVHPQGETGNKMTSQCPPLPPTKVERKVIEKNRRNQMETLISHLNSLIPASTAKHVLTIPDQIDEAINYIKGLEANLQALGKKKEKLLSGCNPTKKRSCSNYNRTSFVSEQLNTSLVELPFIDIRETESSLKIILVTGMDNQFILSDVVRVLHEIGFQVVHANYSRTSNGSITHVLHAQMGDSSLGFGAVKVTERLNSLVNGFTSDHTSMSQPGGAQAFSWDTTVGVPSLLANSGICVSTCAEDEFVNCSGMKNIDSKTDDDQLSLDYSARTRRLPALYLRKLANLLLLINPSRSISPNLRVECLVEVYLPGSDNALLQDLVNLKHLDLSFSSYTKMPNLSRACKLQSLDLQGCNNLVDVLSIQYLTKLEYISLKGCTALMSLPSLMALKSLCSLDVSDCMNLRRLPPSLGCLSNLTALDLTNCKRIQDLPKGILRLKSLQTLSISGCSMLMEHASRSGPGGMLIEHQENPGPHSSLHSSDAELSRSDHFVGKYPSKINLQLPQEERFCDKYNSTGSEDAAKPSFTTQYLERIPMCSPVTSQSPQSCDNNSNTTLSSDLSSEHRNMLKGYMNMPVEAIHQANAFYDIQRIVESLNQRSPNMHESDSLQDLLHCLEELRESVPETMASMHDAHVSRLSFQVALADLGSNLFKADEHYSSLAARFLAISDEEEELDAEIGRLLTKRQELLG